MALRAQTWADFGTDLSLRARGSYCRRTELSWPARFERLHGAAINWPNQYRWPPQWAWLDPIRIGLSEFVPVERVPLAQPSSPVVVFEFLLGTESHHVAVDYSDNVDIDEDLARSVPAYFKMQYLTRGYGISSVIPGGYPPSPRLYALLGGARRLTARPPRRVVYGRFSPRSEVRRRAIDLLQAQKRFTFDGGFALRRYGRHLADSARSAVCLDTPGFGPLCFRLVDYLAVGCCVVSPSDEVSLHVPLRNGIHLTYVEHDLANLVDVCDELLNDPARRSRLAAADFFDRYLESRQLAAYYLSEILTRISDVRSDQFPDKGESAPSSAERFAEDLVPHRRLARHETRR